MGWNYGGKKLSREQKEIASKHLLDNKLICKRCNARNSLRATRCRKCGYSNKRFRKGLRKKAGKDEFKKRQHKSNSGWRK